MYKYFYATMLIAAILLCVMTLVISGSGKLRKKFWRNVLIGLEVIIVVAMVGFIVTL